MTDLMEKTRLLAELHGHKLPANAQAVVEQAKKVFGDVGVTMKEKEPRTELQNNAVHVYFRLLAKALNDAGWDMKKTLKPGIEIPWTEEMVKTHIWKAVQSAMFEKDSTTKLTTKEVNEVYAVVDRHLSEKTGVHVEFPKDEAKP